MFSLGGEPNEKLHFLSAPSSPAVVSQLHNCNNIPPSGPASTVHMATETVLLKPRSDQILSLLKMLHRLSKIKPEVLTVDYKPYLIWLHRPAGLLYNIFPFTPSPP